LAQRLVRKLCLHCKEAYQVTELLITELRLRRYQPAGDIVLYKPKGCAACNQMGYRGRMAIIEFLPMTDAVRKLIMAHAEAGKIQKLAIEEGMQTLYENGLTKVLEGVTTIEEIMRVTAE
jgi:general secretion pathway protein E